MRKAAGYRPARILRRNRHEGQAECEEDLQQVPDHPPAWPGHGYLL
jgi:hypothetical protein